MMTVQPQDQRAPIPRIDLGKFPVGWLTRQLDNRLITRKEFAKQAKISLQAIRTAEKGTSVTVETRRRILKALLDRPAVFNPEALEREADIHEVVLHPDGPFGNGSDAQELRGVDQRSSN